VRYYIWPVDEPTPSRNNDQPMIRTSYSVLARVSFKRVAGVILREHVGIIDHVLPAVHNVSIALLLQSFGLIAVPTGHVTWTVVPILELVVLSVASGTLRGRQLSKMTAAEHI